MVPLAFFILPVIGIATRLLGKADGRAVPLMTERTVRTYLGCVSFI